MITNHRLKKNEIINTYDLCIDKKKTKQVFRNEVLFYF